MSETVAEASYPAGTIAKLLNVTVRRVQQLAKEGVIPKAQRGKYPLVGCVHGYVKFLQELAAGKQPSRELGGAKARDVAASARIKEARALEMEGRLVDAEGVREAMNGAFAQIAAALDGAAGRMTGEIHSLCGGDRGRIQGLVLSQHRLIRRHAAELVEDFCKKRLRPAA